MNTIRKLDHIAAWLCKQIGAGCLLIMVIVTMYDILTRFLFKTSNGSLALYIPGAKELVSYLMLGALLCAIIASIERAQIVVDVFTQKLPTWLKNKLQALFLLGFTAIGIQLAYGFYHFALDAQQYGETTQDLRLPMMPIYAITSALFVLLALRSLVAAINFWQNRIEQPEEWNV